MDYPIKIAAQLRQQLRALRKARGINQTELGLRIGVTQTRVAEIEAKPGVVSAEQLLRIFAALGAELVIRDPGPATDIRPSKDRPSRQAQGTRGAAGKTRGLRFPAAKGSW
jgi:HTH-type transcriptional regulator / antitoxin HipB